ncbi:hypothetical protein QUF90_06715 [Desulfococcaceae bacterium HSG9]|nr:hypothetical protein [Desulfococcaceae bacterium HSG9]
MMDDKEAEALFNEIETKMNELKFKIEIGIPFKKLEDERRIIKIKYLRTWIRYKRKKGFTYQQIGDIFAERNIPTLSSKGKWGSRTIHNIDTGK